jgi:predicted alpha/beta hydrolase family esterase
MKHLIFIHGGDSFLDESSYQNYLREHYAIQYAKPWEESEKPDWKKRIAKKWTEKWYTAWYPPMPNKQNARYADWKIVFESILEKIDTGDEVTLVGGSLGGCFLLKYFWEIEKYHGNTQTESDEPINLLFIQGIHLLAACISEWDFRTPENYHTLGSLGSKVHIWHAEDDRVVPFSTGEMLAQELPNATTHFFWSEKWYGHFHGIESIPELEEIILI